jgi:uncharacterized protein involved in outer membrane biogenesis
MAAANLEVLNRILLIVAFAVSPPVYAKRESAVADSTGPKLQLGGAFDLDIVPSPGIVLEDVSLSNAEWAPSR